MKMNHTSIANILVIIAGALLVLARLVDPTSATLNKRISELGLDTSNPTISSTPTTQGERFVVERVIDGDTIILENEEKIRLIGIDAPELHKTKGRSSCFGAESKTILTELVEGKTITLMRDKTNRDRYGRLLRYIFLEDGSDELTLVNEWLVASGAAVASSYPPDTSQDERISIAQTTAQSQNAGLWANCDN